jgi:hypothetical protein
MAWPYTSSDIDFISMFATARTEFLLEDVTWELDYTAVAIKDDISYNSINFDIHFKRRHPYFTVTLLIPLCFIGVLNIMNFAAN